MRADLRRCYHLDTNYLIEFLRSKNGAREEQPKEASKVIHRALIRKEGIRISQFTVGEFLSVISEKRSLSLSLQDLQDWIETGQVEPCRIKKDQLKRFGYLVQRIRSAESWIEATDIVLAACSMADKECHGFLTFERSLIESRGLKRVIDEHILDRKGFVITSDPFAGASKVPRR